MFERLKNLYLTGRISKTGLDNAVEKNWITKEEKKLILGLK